ncbi:TPM domain-containing protein [Marinoscillum pacificum]|uniref:TPM domain-containing protein n=1 Tax=Marinoscillum pacificum TaxID=392723 RepID=UPI00215773EE|nr:TPM domain-containing protein [Marinoscillum pacificum]
MIKNTLYFLYLILSISLGCNTTHQQPRANAFKSLNVPNLYARVNDYADILTDPEEDQLNDLLKSLEDSIGSQLIILTIDSLDERTIEEYSMDVANDWRIGRADYNDGILITLAMKDRKIRIEVGYGLEQIIRDEIAKKIIDSTMLPEFRKGDFYSGLTKASQVLIDLIYGNPNLVGNKWTPEKKEE